jgi:hypothetical protein
MADIPQMLGVIGRWSASFLSLATKIERNQPAMGHCQPFGRDDEFFWPVGGIPVTTAILLLAGCL